MTCQYFRFLFLATIYWCIAGNGGVLGASVVVDPVLLLPATPSNTLSVNLILATVFSVPETRKCTLCRVVAELTQSVTCLLDGSCGKSTEELVSFHCLKANTSDFFVISLTDPTIQSLFDFSIPFGILTHGFTDYFPGQVFIDDQGWVSKTAIGWAAMGINVCVVNWEGLSKYLFNYFVVSQINTVRVANYIVQLIEFLESNGLDISETSLAGHSLGAQISGKVGAALIKRGKMLKSIYGLDPAGPCFTFPCTVDLDDRLDETDANHVQCIHTNIGVIGQVPQCGCADFYLNQGIVQPGALDPISAHYFACKIFAWTLDKEHKCRAKSADAIVGIHGQEVCGLYYIDTRAAAPYCEGDGGLVSGLI